MSFTSINQYLKPVIAKINQGYRGTYCYCPTCNGEELEAVLGYSEEFRGWSHHCLKCHWRGFPHQRKASGVQVTTFHQLPYDRRSPIGRIDRDGGV